MPHVHVASRRLESSSSSSSSSSQAGAGGDNNFVKRLTLFKVAKDEDIEAVLKAYEILRSTALRDGKPYIVSNSSRRILNTSSPLSEGYTIASQSIFKNHQDHAFYDQECPAHRELKKTTSRVRTGVMTVVTEGPL
ncbi:uncharacterized protein SEPMUDRAFT_33688 [Sphaerulina musiva SO2202]|uniref:Stress-response A/B barrel domain-containing protein n=1 Tax=Sphaerulina musiva (strain SO2202) TaxID=692275 RepID=N1QJ46_SPHMS|nr:uncharacterized protein SEPMUDRAFT_33688 [Sphaerulina musiva SO2202]EMF17251.1 hypothetical protein SEPMUDRAFT_33688 [Sphaerulina musiva SO2202]